MIEPELHTRPPRRIMRRRRTDWKSAFLFCGIPLGIVLMASLSPDRASLIYWAAPISVLTSLYAMVWMPSRQRWLIREGTVTTGIITGTMPAKYGCTLSYSFRCEGSSRTIASTTLVTKAEAFESVVGGPITVLYDPRKPERNTPYLHSPYRALP